MKNLSRIFKAVADETRLKMMALLLREGELCVCDCVGALDITQSKASRHLRYLANAGLLVDRRKGAWVYYRISEQLAGDHQALVDLLAQLLTDVRCPHLVAELGNWKERKLVEGPGCPD